MSQLLTREVDAARPMADLLRRPGPERGRGGERKLRLGAAPLLALVAAAGLVLVALGNNAARESAAQAQPLFWGGLVVIYTPIALRLLSTGASREERIALSVLLGGSLFLVKVLYNPLGFTLHDELATWRQTSDFLQGGDPLSANPIVTGYAGFPGVELLTAAVRDVTGLGLFASAVIVIGVTRMALMLALFLFLERVSGSHRAAGAGIAVYACNPSFLYFDSQFAYESLALLLGAVLLLAALRWTRIKRPAPQWSAQGQVLAMALLACTLAITHHMTSYAVTGFLLLWTLMILLAGHAARPASGTDRGRGSRAAGATWIDGPALPAMFLALAGAAWFAFAAGRVTTTELGGVLSEAISSVANLLFGGSDSKTLFQAGGQTNTMAARILGVASVLPLLAIIPIGLWRTWRRPDPSPIWRALAIVALFFPVALLLRFTQAGTETSQRASEFVFVGLAFVAGLLLSEMRWPRQRLRGAAVTVGLASLATVMFVGGFIIGESPATRQPGPFLIGGEARSVSPQGIAAAKFAAAELPAGSRVIVDRPNSTLLSSYGHLERVTGEIDGVPVTRVFFSPVFDEIDQRVISDDAIDFIIVDRRLSHGPPVTGYYFEAVEPRANRYAKPISRFALSKFNHVAGLSKVFDNGAIVIYDTRGLRSG